jgi:hypothetical protein
VSEDGEAVRLVAERLIRWDTRADVPEVAVLQFDPRSIGEHQLLELRSLMDEAAGRTPVQLQFPTERGFASWLVEGVKVDAARLTELEAHCPWLTTRVTVDRQRLLAAERPKPWEQRGGSNGASAGSGESPSRADVPF